MLDPRTHQPTNPFQLYDETTRNRTHHTSTNYYNTWESANTNSAGNNFWPYSKTQTKPKQEDDESGMCSPPLWASSPSRDDATTRINNHHHYRSLSPASRTQAIVRGQRELMEMVRTMPESNYELSLKDLVEHHRGQQQENTAVVEGKVLKGGGGSGRKVMGQVVKRSGTIDRRGAGGFYLKMAIPSFSLGSKDKKKNKKNENKKKNESLANGSSKVSPRPSVSDGSGKGGGVDKEWWKKSSSGSRESTDSGASSINSGSTKSSGSTSSNSSGKTSNSRHRHEKSGGRCWPCIPRSKRQTKK